MRKRFSFQHDNETFYASVASSYDSSSLEDAILVHFYNSDEKNEKNLTLFLDGKADQVDNLTPHEMLLCLMFYFEHYNELYDAAEVQKKEDEERYRQYWNSLSLVTKLKIQYSEWKANKVH